MTHEHGGEQAPAPVVAGEAFGDSNALLRSVQRPGGSGAPESLVTVLVAFAINILIAVAKSVAAAVTGSASMLAEAAHSWADAGNEVFLLVADRRSRRPAHAAHPFGHGREAYVWSLLAGVGLAIRPYLQQVHGPASPYVAALQRLPFRRIEQPAKRILLHVAVARAADAGCSQ